MFTDKAEKYQIEKYKLLLKVIGYLTKINYKCREWHQ